MIFSHYNYQSDPWVGTVTVAKEDVHPTLGKVAVHVLVPDNYLRSNRPSREMQTDSSCRSDC